MKYRHNQAETDTIFYYSKKDYQKLFLREMG